jgi:SAM-dependent methyltransferase
VKTVKAPAEDPKLTAGSLDAVLVVNAYHEFEKFAPALEKLREALKPGGRLVMIENVPRKVHTQPRKIQMDNHVMAADVVEPEIKAAGFQIVERDDKFIDHPEDETVQWLMVATPGR